MTLAEYGIGYTNNNIAFLFDKEDYEKIKNICWYVDSVTGYLRGYDSVKRKKVHLHRVVMNADENEIVDHINHDLLNCRKSNLRKCSKAQNCQNHKTRPDCSSGYSGVYFDKSRDKWVSYITVKNKRVYVGRFSEFGKAIEARRIAEQKYYGEFAYKDRKDDDT